MKGATKIKATMLLISLSMLLAHTLSTPEDFIDLHNAIRAEVGVEPLTWDDALAAYAQHYANHRAKDCQLVHSGGRYGENIFWGSPGREWTAGDAVNMWVEERKDYDYGTNSCAGGKVCGHYTQVVWRGSVRLGCAEVKCDDGGEFVTCNYSPSGNIFGQRPY